MKKCKELNFFSKELIIDIFTILVVSMVLHFTFEYSGKNLLVAIFSATNESIWEHIKIVVMSTYLVTFIKLSIVEKREYNLWTAMFIRIISLIMLLIILLYLYNMIFLVENLLIVMIIILSSLIISKIIEEIIICKFKTTAKLDEFFKYVNIGIILLFILFTFYTPKLDIFKDKINNIYGL